MDHLKVQGDVFYLWVNDYELQGQIEANSKASEKASPTDMCSHNNVITGEENWKYDKVIHSNVKQTDNL